MQNIRLSIPQQLVENYGFAYNKHMGKHYFNQLGGNSVNILWDLDGTLFDTYPKLMASFQKLAGKQINEDELIRWLKKIPNKLSNITEFPKTSDKNIKKLIYSLKMRTKNRFLLWKMF